MRNAKTALKVVATRTGALGHLSQDGATTLCGKKAGRILGALGEMVPHYTKADGTPIVLYPDCYRCRDHVPATCNR